MRERAVQRFTAPFEVGEWTVDPGLDRIERAGTTLALEPRTMDLLLCLARNAGETVAKETLLAEVWGGAFVVESVIAKTVSALRTALGDDAAHPTYILTVPRRGYRLVASVRQAKVADAARASTPPEADAAPSVDRATDTSPAPAEPSVSPAVEAAVPRIGIRRPVRYFLIALGIAALFAVAMPWGGRSPASAPPRQPSAPALSASLQNVLLEARLLWSKRGIDSIKRANNLLREAVKEAPESAEVRGWLALTYVTRGNYLGGQKEAFALAKEEVEQAMRLDERSAIAHTAAAALAVSRDHDPDSALRHATRAVELDPDLQAARQFRAEALSLLGRDAEALVEIDDAIRVDPLSAVLHGVRGLILLRADRWLASLEEYDRVLALEPAFGWVHRNRGWALHRLGREQEMLDAIYLEAVAALEEPEHLATLRVALDEDGLAGYWRWRLARLDAVRAQGAVIRPTTYAEALAGVGRREEALAEIERAASSQDGEYFFYFRDSVGFDSIRDDPRFRAAYTPRSFSKPR